MVDFRASISRGYCSKLENGLIENPGILNLQSICRVLQIPLSWVLVDDDRTESALPPLTYPELEDVTANLVAIQENDPERLVALRTIILDVREQAELKGKRKSRST
jgi:transcriptional regulator with XRE-family HTH domain